MGSKGGLMIPDEIYCFKGNIRFGIIGNWYCISEDKQELIKLCKALNKSIDSIYWSTKYNIFAFRVKNKKQINMLKNIKNYLHI